MATYKQCDCNFCGNSLRFEISKAGELVNCQDCSMETVLFLPDAEQPYPQEQFYVEATNIGWFKNGLGFRNIVGVIVNNSCKDLDWVRIEFTLVNRDAMPIGSTSDCLINFPVDRVWRFKAPVFQNDAAGVSAPLVSCEYGKIVVPKRVVHPAAAAQPPAVPTAPAPLQPQPPRLAIKEVKPQEAKRPDVKRVTEWTGLRITGGVTGVAHHR